MNTPIAIKIECAKGEIMNAMQQKENTGKSGRNCGGTAKILTMHLGTASKIAGRQI